MADLELSYPSLDKSKPHGIVTPPWEGAHYEQNGFHFDAAGDIVKELITPELTKRLENAAARATAEKAADAARVARKEPFLEGGRAVDGFFKSRVGEPLDKAKKGVEAKLGVYLRGKAERERQARARAEADARRAADEAAAAARRAEEAMRTEKDLDRAMAAAKEAEDAEAQRVAATKAATAKPADLSRTRGDAGALGTLQARWTFKDIDRNSVNLELLRNYLSVDEIGKAVRLYIKAMGADEMKRIVTVEGRQPIKGVTIFEEQAVSVR